MSKPKMFIVVDEFNSPLEIGTKAEIEKKLMNDYDENELEYFSIHEIGPAMSLSINKKLVISK